MIWIDDSVPYWINIDNLERVSEILQDKGKEKETKFYVAMVLVQESTYEWKILLNKIHLFFWKRSFFSYLHGFVLLFMKLTICLQYCWKNQCFRKEV